MPTLIDVELRLVNATAVTEATALFSGLDLTVTTDSVIGVIGPNGCGKTTLLRVLSGVRELDDGQRFASPGLRVGWMPQRRCSAKASVEQYLAQRTGVQAATAELDRASTGLGAQTAQAADRYDAALQQWLAIGAADLPERIPAALAAVGLEVAPGTPTDALSGGQRARLDLAALRLASHDVLLLDEPTNDLDLPGLALLEDFVASSRAGIVVVSHDREFLAATLNEVLEFDPVLATVRQYSGGYQSYQRERRAARQRAVDDREQYEQHVAQLRTMAAEARDRTQRGVRNADRAYRQGKVDKLTRDRMKDGATSGGSRAADLTARIDRIEVVDAPRKQWQLQLTIPPSDRSGDVVFTASEATLRRGEFMLGPITCQVNQGERVLITGDNGSGKTTLLALLTGELAPDSGRVSIGAGVVMGRIDQERQLAGPTLLEGVAPQLPDFDDASLRTLLAKFGLAGADLTRSSTTVSPGELTRARLAILQGRGCNTLIVDEPTNHLDLMAVEQLEQALASFPGTLLVVSHDRRLVSALSEAPIVRWRLVNGRMWTQ